MQTFRIWGQFLVLLFIVLDSGGAAGATFTLVEKLNLWPASSFSRPTDAASVESQFDGIIRLYSSNQTAFQIVEDPYELIKEHKSDLASLPVFEIEIISENGFIIPVQRGVQRTNHPHWEYLFEPGRYWSHSAKWKKASMPFALSERNANCTHNGLIDFLFNEQGIIKDARIQIAAETCAYFKFNLQGRLRASFEQTKTHYQQNFNAYQAELLSKEPRHSLEQLSRDYPDVDQVMLKPKDWKNTSLYGVIINDKYYISQCPTRAGDYPYCEQFALPSYSLAKTIFAGLSYLYIDSLYSDFSSSKITDFIPECINNRWQNVNIEQLIDMVTGHYQSSEKSVDESADTVMAFFDSQSLKEKIGFSCNAYPYKETAGSTWVYHTSDHFLAGVFMTRFMRDKTKNSSFDLFTELLYENVFQPLKVSPLLSDTKRTYDAEAQPFVGWGLTLLADDLVKITRFINGSNEDVHLPKPFIEKIQSVLNEKHINSDSKYQYQAGFWKFNLNNYNICQQKQWLPFLSGYGGISVLLFPNKMVYFSFTDGYQHLWKNAALALNNIMPYCQKNVPKD